MNIKSDSPPSKANTRTDKIPEFSTGDIHLAAFMRARGAEIIRVDGTQNRIIWTFRGPNVESLQLAYVNGAAVSAIDFATALRFLKTMTRPTGGGER